jgi:polyferredoxin/plastocyanin
MNQRWIRLIVLVFMSILLINTQALAKDVVIELKAKKFYYTPNIVKVQKGDNVTIRLISQDVHHGFYLDGYEIQTDAVPGRDGTLTFVADKSGKFNFRCSVTCGEFHPYMIGYLKVEPNYLFYAGITVILLMMLGSIFFVSRRKSSVDNKLFGFIPLSWKFELSKYKWVRKILKSRWFPLIPILFNLAIFTIILMADFLGGFSTGNYNFGVMIVWILWWFILMAFLVPIIGRAWCMMCPFPIFGDWIQRGKLAIKGRTKLNGLNKKWPKKWRNLWPVTILFFISTWASGFFTVRPFASFILLGVIIGLSVVIALIYEKRTFCLYICPVSGFQGLFANFSMVEVRVKDPEICKNHKPKTCVVGNEKGYGCPWMEIPFDMNRNTYCGLCMECFKTCPHDNMALNVRTLGTDFVNPRRKTDEMYKRRGLDEAFKALSMMGIFISFFIAFQGPIGFIKDQVRGTTVKGYLSYIAEASIVDFLILPLSYLAFVYLSKLVSGNKEVKLKTVFSNYSACLVILGVGIWASFATGVIFPNGSYILHIISDPFAWGWDLFGTANFPWTPVLTGVLPYLQVLILWGTFMVALSYGFKLSLQTYPGLKEAKRGWFPILSYLVIVILAAIYLFVG